MSEEIQVNGRKRGRPKGSTKAFARAAVWQSKGVGPLKANDVLLMADERQQWKRVFGSEDERVILQAMMFLVSMRDGRPAQQINLTSLNINVRPEDIERARSVARELMTEQAYAPTSQDTSIHTLNPSPNPSPSVRGKMESENAGERLMLSGGEGEENGG